MSHTPTPWQHRTAIGIVDGDNELIADTYKSPYALDAIIANAAHIVHCVNAWDNMELLKARIVELEGQHAK